MAIPRKIGNTPSGQAIHYGTDDERIAFTGAAPFTVFKRNDGAEFVANGNGGWVQTNIGGAERVETQSGSTNAYGPHPAAYFNLNDLTGSLTAAATGTTIAEIVDASGINFAAFSVPTLTGTGAAVAAYGSHDGVTYEPDKLRLIRLSDKAESVSVTTAATGPYAVLFQGAKFKKLKLVYELTSGTGNVATRGSSGWV